MILLDGICKTFKVARRDAGFSSAVKALFNKQYEYVEALKDVSFSVADGEIIGYIGPNGAGKSSTIKIMSGILVPDRGQCVINGRTPWKDRVRHVREVGIVFGQRSQLWWDVPVADSFELLKAIYEIPSDTYRRNYDTLVSMLSLSTIVKTPARQLSLGQRMRCEIAAALLHSPKVLFLDEPTIGLDAVSKIAVRDFVRSINRENGTTVILTTHDMQDIEALSSRIIMIGRGRILLDGPIEELRRRYSGNKTLTVDYSGATPELCAGLSFADNLYGRAVLRLDSSVISVAEAIAYVSGKVELYDVSVTGMTSEDIVVELYKEFEI